MTPTGTVLELLRLYGPLALCLFVFLETSMLFPFLPSEVVVPAAAALLVTDAGSFLLFVTAAAVGGTAGAFVPYRVASRTDAGTFGRFADHINVSETRLERGRRWFRRWGQWSVCWGRFLPVLRSVVSVPAGFARMQPLRFAVLTAVGTVGFYAATAAVVYYGRQRSLFSAVVAVAADRPVLIVVGLLVVFGLWRVGRRWFLGS